MKVYAVYDRDHYEQYASTYGDLSLFTAIFPSYSLAQSWITELEILTKGASKGQYVITEKDIHFTAQLQLLAGEKHEE